MATQTAHFELEKPALTDVADIAVLNNNFDDIDTVMFANQERSVAAVSNQADAYDAAQTYAVGDLVIYENRLYKCTTAVTVAESWDSTKWTQTTLAESGGTGVEANPTGTPTDTLETIDINGTVYEVGGSKPVSKTVTGNPIHIADAAAAPIVSGEVTFEPKQDLHGYDKPWAGGAGKNKLPLTVDGIKALNTTGTWSGNVYSHNNATFELLTDTDNNIIGIKVNSSGTTGNAVLYLVPTGTSSLATYLSNGVSYKANGATSSSSFRFDVESNGEWQTITSEGAITFTYTSGGEDRARIFGATGSSINNLVFYPMIRLATETDPTFEPYSNICPIEGYTDCELEVTGKNLVSPSLVMSVGTNNGVTSSIADETYHLSGTTNATGYYFGSRNNYITLLAGTYTLSVFPNGTFGTSTEIRLRKQSDNSRIVSVYINQTESASFTLDSDTAVFVGVVDSSSPSGTTISGQFTIQLEVGSTATATAYEPYQSTTYTIDLEGTRYGGKVYPVTGKMSVGIGRIASYAGETIGEPWLSDRDEYVAGTTPTIGAEVVYTLASPTIVQLTPEQIRTLEGTNNISTNMTSMMLEYITQEYQSLVKLIERSAGHHYSEQERVVGTWFGNTRYEKVVDFGALPNATTKDLNHGIANVDTIFIVGGYAKNTTSGFVQQLNVPVPSNNQAEMQSQWYFGVTATYIRCFTLADRTSYDECKVILQYTKTTD